ncbi:hypothetical protein GCM10007904_00790 [Oharaeibacter diazotrophicus]|nr:hypothetical protein GCM10007904_00790 [Oharaeibacter diazotrophicus]
MSMSIELSEQMKGYLKRGGLPSRIIAQCDGATRMYHDLGIYGDIAESYMEILAREYFVDMKYFYFNNYFPTEFSTTPPLRRTLIWLLPFFRESLDRNYDFEPVTLRRIERAIESKRWE